MTRVRVPPTFKVGEEVCFFLADKENDLTKRWFMGVVARADPHIEKGSTSVSIFPFIIADVWTSAPLMDEWESQALLPVVIPMTAVIMDRLSAQTKFHPSRGRPLEVNIWDICRARPVDFQKLLQGGKPTSETRPVLYRRR